MSIGAKLRSSLIMMGIIPLLLIAITFLVAYNSLSQNISDRLDSLASIQQTRIEQAVEDKRKKVESISSDEELVKAVTTYKPDSLSTRLEIERILATYKSYYTDFLFAKVLNLQGKVIAGTSINTSFDRYFEENEFVQNVESSSIIPYKEGDTTILLIAETIDVEGQTNAVLVVATNIDSLNSITGDYTGLGETGETVISYRDQQDEVQLLTELRFEQKRNILNNKDKLKEPAMHALEREEEVFTDVLDYRNTSVIAATRHIENINWGVVAKMDTREAFSNINQLRKLAFISIPLVFLVMTLTAEIAAGSISRPLKELSEVAVSFSKENFSAKIRTKLVNSKDEVGTLAKALSKMREQIVHSYSILEKEVQEKTRSLTENLINLERQNVELGRTKTAMLNILDDMEQEKQKIKQQMTETKKFEQAVEAATDAIAIIDLESNILYTNPTWTKLNGYTLEEVRGKKLNFLESDKSGTELYEHMFNVVNTGKPYTTDDAVIKRKNGSEYQANISTFPIVENGITRFFVSMSRDVTKRKEIDRMRSEFIALVSHQLRTPLSASKWFIEMLLDGDAGEITESQKDYLLKAFESNERMIVLVNSLMDVSRIETGSIKHQQNKENLSDLINSVIDELDLKLEARQQQINVSIDKDVPKVMLDKKLIRVVYLNLLENALKYSPEKSEIKLEVTKKGNKVLSKIQDKGFGIPEEEQDRVFNKFYRGNNVIQVVTDGNGLGLYMTKSIIESSGGSIWFDSVLNKGTTFYFELPINGIEEQNKETK